MEHNNEQLIYELDNDQLVTVLLWTLRDLENWSNAEETHERVSGFASMLYEAICYQITKALQIKEVIAIAGVEQEEE